MVNDNDDGDDAHDSWRRHRIMIVEYRCFSFWLLVLLRSAAPAAAIAVAVAGAGEGAVAEAAAVLRAGRWQWKQ